MKKVTIFTDGACSGNPGIGGWGVVLCYKDKKKEMSGYDKSTTNNRMELFAVIQGLRALKEPCQVDVCTDSQYIADAFNKHWIESWQSRGWKTSAKDAVKNVDLWQALLIEVRKHDVTFVKVKGHADVELNERCDKLATGAVASYKQLIAEKQAAQQPVDSSTNSGADNN